MKTYLRKLHLDNFKLFMSKDIDFQGIRLTVFDGPNGYGKTTTFDAIELLVTGSIKRIAENSAIDGTKGYDTVFLANDTELPVRVLGEFIDVDQDIIFSICVMIDPSLLKGKDNNPKSIFKNAKTYFFKDTPIDNLQEKNVQKGECCTSEEIDAFRKQFFGVHYLENYSFLNYISQEERLSYFQKNEKDRTKDVTALLGIEQYSKKCVLAKKQEKILKQKVATLQSDIDAKTKLIQTQQGQRSNSENTYQCLFPERSDIIWDIADISFSANQEELLNQYLSEIDGLEKYIQYEELHDIRRAKNYFDTIQESHRFAAAWLWYCQQIFPFSYTTLQKYADKKQFFDRQFEFLEEKSFQNLALADLCDEFCPDEKETIITKWGLVNTLKNTQSVLAKEISAIIETRERLREQYVQKQTISEKKEEGMCPYCGKTWETWEGLDIQYRETANRLNDLCSNQADMYTKELRRFEKLVKEKIVPKMRNKHQFYQNSQILQMICQFQTAVYAEAAVQNIAPFMDIVSKELSVEKVTLSSGDNVLDIVVEDEKISQYLELVEQKSHSITAEYLNDCKKYHFDRIDKDYLQKELVSTLSLGVLDQKKQFLKSKFYASLDGLIIEINELENQKNEMEEIRIQMETYRKALEAAIKSYTADVIKLIGIPFFLYTSRLLQSYQGGQGVYINTEDSDFRFCNKTSEHDVTYTMSSGQMSAILLAFSLIMHKTFGQKGLATVLIDDPIQCMDDINMISFVDLLRNEFKNNQIILSTHEDGFSDYISYKYAKEELKVNQISLKDEVT